MTRITISSRRGSVSRPERVPRWFRRSTGTCTRFRADARGRPPSIISRVRDETAIRRIPAPPRLPASVVAIAGNPPALRTTGVWQEGGKRKSVPTRWSAPENGGLRVAARGDLSFGGHRRNLSPNLNAIRGRRSNLIIMTGCAVASLYGTMLLVPPFRHNNAIVRSRLQTVPVRIEKRILKGPVKARLSRWTSLRSGDLPGRHVLLHAFEGKSPVLQKPTAFATDRRPSNGLYRPRPAHRPLGQPRPLKGRNRDLLERCPSGTDRRISSPVSSRARSPGRRLFSTPDHVRVRVDVICRGLAASSPRRTPSAEPQTLLGSLSGGSRASNHDTIIASRSLAHSGTRLVRRQSGRHVGRVFRRRPTAEAPWCGNRPCSPATDVLAAAADSDLRAQTLWWPGPCGPRTLMAIFTRLACGRQCRIGKSHADRTALKFDVHVASPLSRQEDSHTDSSHAEPYLRSSWRRPEGRTGNR